MTRFLQLLLGPALLAVSLSACATPPAGDPPKGDAPPGLCNASTLEWTIGRPATEQLVHEAQQQSGAKTVRVLKPGQMVTMEYSDQRLNIYVDAANKVERYGCG